MTHPWLIQWLSSSGSLAWTVKLQRIEWKAFKLTKSHLVKKSYRASMDLHQWSLRSSELDKWQVLPSSYRLWQLLDKSKRTKIWQVGSCNSWIYPSSLSRTDLSFYAIPKQLPLLQKNCSSQSECTVNSMARMSRVYLILFLIFWRCS